ncbi:hypothetical protein ACJ72_03785 [Emergomyces africanus]|uniref:DUF6604 domain-containing protein n=1 Tax=Emergomyces africanus TaxID=1955775 RepID=A0A1B7NYM6_9EURO|nr:hypothetical protein ACJ72_03785 [Emergomyces africanus]
MLSDLQTSSYLQYKANTDAVVSWLATTARERGYPIDLRAGNPSSQRQEQQQQPRRLKSTSKKQAHEAEAGRKTEVMVEAADGPGPKLSTGTLPVKEYTRLAEYVAAATDPLIVVPASIETALYRAITTRREYSIEIASRSPRDEESKASDDRHAHFIRVLEEVREILRPRFATNPAKYLADAGANKPIVEPNVKILRNLANKFESLEVQEPSQEFVEAPNIIPDAVPPPKINPKVIPDAPGPPKVNLNVIPPATPLPKVKEEVKHGKQSLRAPKEACFGFGLLLQDCATLQIFIYIPELDIKTRHSN